MVQSLVVFADDPTTALCRSLLQKKELRKFLLEPLVAFSQKLAPAEIARLYGICTCNMYYKSYMIHGNTRWPMQLFGQVAVMYSIYWGEMVEDLSVPLQICS